MQNRVPRAWCQSLNFYKRFSVLHIIGLKSTDKVSRPQRRACGRDPPFLFFVSRETCACDLWPAASACGLWCVLVGGTHPYFLFMLEGWWNTTSPLFLFRNFHFKTVFKLVTSKTVYKLFTLADVRLR